MENCKLLWGNLRLSPLTSGLIRIEYAKNGAFLDDKTLFAENREFDNSFIDIKEQDGTLIIRSQKYTLYCKESAKLEPDNRNIYAEIHPEGEMIDIWFYGKKNRGNLGGTLTTLDGVRGKTPPPEGLIARDGWQIIDDSNKPTLTADGWIQSRDDNHIKDLYLFTYGTDYKSALKDLAYVSGKMKMPARCTLGSWYSRWWPYTSEEFLELVDDYQKNDFPLDILVMDMDWHFNDWAMGPEGENHPNMARTGKGHAGNLGWTGYTWNTHLIPDPQYLMNELKKRNITVTLNDHPADGIRHHESCYEGFKKELGYEPKEEGLDPLLRAADKKYMDAFFKYAHGILEDQGVAFWWLDWQQKGEIDAIKRLNHLPWLNYLYYQNSKRCGKRGISFSRWGGFGDHKHPIYFSGDIKSKWEALRYEIVFTARAANCGCFYWSHDTGGFFGDRNPEMYVRWVQFCMTSASMRLHSQRDEKLDRRPWKWGEKESNIMRDMFHLRSRLIPYIYSTSRQSEKESIPFIRPMYYDFPLDERSYHYDEQYYLGDALLCSPISHPGEGEEKISEKLVWIPNGTYYNFFTGEKVKPNCLLEEYCSLDTFPMYIKGGFPIPLQPYCERMTAASSDTIIIKAYPSVEDCENTFNLFDDDGITDSYEQGKCLNTAITYKKCDDTVEISIIPDSGFFEGCPESRKFILELEGYENPIGGIKSNTDYKLEVLGHQNRIEFAKADIHAKIKFTFKEENNEPA